MICPTVGTNGMAMPKLGLGTWKLSGASCTDAVHRALALGYRHIDTAEMYGNEAEIGAALAQSHVARREIFLTSKVWYEHLAPAALQAALDASLQRLRCDYLDLYLIHWPAPNMDLAASLAIMMRAQEAGKIRHIGVSNFPVSLLREAVETLGAPIACNQVEYHVLLGQRAVLAYARAHGIVISAYCPLAQGRLGEHPVLDQIAAKHQVSAAQVALAWLFAQDGVAAIPKAARAESQQANLAALTVRLDAADHAAIAALPKDQRFVNPGFGPIWDKP
jgi:2,5-diketo-D-gluconate reductase B